MDRTRSATVALLGATAFPDGCGDAFDHMIDRLRDGKSPIGFCSMSDGQAFEEYEIDYGFRSAATANGWECPEGSTLEHSVRRDEEDNRVFVNVLCYETKRTVRIGERYRDYYTGTSRPERRDFMIDITMNPAVRRAMHEPPLERIYAWNSRLGNWTKAILSLLSEGEIRTVITGR